MIKEFLATVLFAFSSGTPLTKTTPYKANLYKVGGMYNLRNSPNTDLTSKYKAQGTTTSLIYFDTSVENGQTPLYLDPLRIQGTTYYLESMQLNYTGLQEATYITVNFYEQDSTRQSFQFNYFDTARIEYLQDFLRDMYFYVRESVLLDEVQTDLFNAIFTKEENLYTKNYTGYYSFNTNENYIDCVLGMYGNITIGQNMYYTIEEDTTSSFKLGYYDASTSTFSTTTLSLPFSATGQSSQWYLTVKMSQSEYDNWGQCGTFGYVPQVTPDAYSFSDLFFNLADTPIYFIYSIFNWQLFGANLFIAFIGLVSFALILLLFRRFL